jgi:iron(III) transport system substrate-binding protein
MNSPADVLLTTDAGRLIRAQQADVLQPVSSAVLKAAIPSQYRDPEGHWFGLSIRARVMFYAPDRVQPDELSTYEDLASPKWRDRICIRSSSNVYNQSLLASLIAHNGAEAAEKWAGAVVGNMARKPQGGDRDQIKAVAAGQCDVAVANSYYYGGMLASSKASEHAPATRVKLFWPNQQGRGAHVNISGGGITKSAPHKANAIRFLEFLAGKEAQKLYAQVVYEYPVRADVKASGVVAGFGPFKADSLNLAQLADHNAEAVRIFDRAGWR